MIHIDNISFSYTGESPYLLENLSLDVKDGDYISIVGSNGSGKSTLLKLILGFI
ncbi:MAG: ATP-binding cassette domain-containing protein, partial [Dialister sp.]|nr:ATP-binding cassette domain-containing protein [Dialister sp.]